MQLKQYINLILKKKKEVVPKTLDPHSYKAGMLSLKNNSLTHHTVTQFMNATYFCPYYAHKPKQRERERKGKERKKGGRKRTTE